MTQGTPGVGMRSRDNGTPARYRPYSITINIRRAPSRVGADDAGGG